jgi:ribosomal protein S18 acetylase RimI-like enzyme
MPLPILQSSAASSTPEALVRYFHQTERDWTRHVAEETPLDDIGTAFHNAQLDRVWDANCVLDAALDEGMFAGDAVAAADAHFTARGATCWRWVMNPSAEQARTRPLVDHLLSRGYRMLSHDVMHLAHLPDRLVVEVPGLKIIPSRASFRDTHGLALEASENWNEPQLADATVEHVQDPHFDSLLALRDGRAVATAGVLAVGEIGRIENVYVAKDHRRLGIGRTMMSRVLEVCARSLFKHVLLCVADNNSAAQTLYAQLGFVKVGQMLQYVAPNQPRP